MMGFIVDEAGNKHYCVGLKEVKEYVERLFEQRGCVFAK